jgi:hypothetical protein
VNSADPASGPLVTVGQWRTTYLVPRSHPAPQDLQRRLDEAMAGRLVEDCGRRLRQALDPADPSVWRIRELAMNFSAESHAAASDAAARNWGRQLAARIQDVISQEEQSDSVLRFASQAAFVAQFVTDLVAARAWGKWYYEEFDDLRLLPVSQAIRTVLLRYGSGLVETILQLASTGRLEPVLCRLNEDAAREIFHACFDSADFISGAGLDKWTGIILELWNEAPLRPSAHEEGCFRDALRLFARVASRFPDAKNRIHFRAAIESLLELRAVLTPIRSPAVLDAIFRALANGNLASAIGLARDAGVADSAGPFAFLAERAGGDAHWAGQAAAVIMSDDYRERFLTSANAASGESILSSFGGVFLLAPSLQELNLAEMAETAAHRCESPETVSALFRHLVAVKCLGQARAVESADDPALRLFSGLEGCSFRDAVANCDASTLSLDAAREILLRSLADVERIDDRCFFAELVSLPNRDVLVVLDLGRNEWLDAVDASVDGSNLAGLLRERVSMLSLILGARPALLLLSGALTGHVADPRLGEVAGSVAVLRPDDDKILGEIAALLGVARERLTDALTAGERELSYFSLSGPRHEGNPDPGLDCACTLVARAALKSFARRLLGFEASSPEYLFQNFLAGLTSIRSMDDFLEVCLPTSPLSLVLRISGAHEQRFTLPWLKGREVCLLPPKE